MARKIHVKPGRAPAAMSMVVGGIFVLLGIFVVIPTFGPFGIFWTLVAAAMTGFSAVNVFSSKGVTTSTIVVEDEEDIPQEKSVEERLRTLEDLYNKRVITREEYEESRKRILEEL